MIGERAGDGHALLLAAGKLVGRVVGAVAEADGFQRLQRPLALALAVQPLARVKHRQLDVFQGGRARKQVEALKDEADFLIADVGQFVAVELRNINARRKNTFRPWAGRDSR